MQSRPKLMSDIELDFKTFADCYNQSRNIPVAHFEVVLSNERDAYNRRTYVSRLGEQILYGREIRDGVYMLSSQPTLSQ